MAAENFVPAQAFPPGEYIKDELEARGWTQADLAEILGRPAKVVSDLVAGKTSISPETAHGLGEAFGTGAQVWMNLDSAYRLWKLQPNDAIARRAKLYTKGPIKEMIRRGFIEGTNDIDLLEERVMAFYQLPGLESELEFPYAARKPTEYATTTPAQFAWLFRAKALARSAPVEGHFSDESLTEALRQIKRLLLNAPDIRQVARILSVAGIRFVVVQPLEGTKIDGVTFWLDPKSPVIALSMRYGRIDWFWFTLLHELDHVRNGEGAVDVRLVGQDRVPTNEKSAAERRADLFAENFEIPREQTDSFIARVSPLFSKVRIAGFAAVNQVHPGIVVGQLQHRGVIGYQHSREVLIDVRSFVVESALTDGWGNYVPPEKED
jgi:HTH-type transcriptional regulator / antitoxin HigA